MLDVIDDTRRSNVGLENIAPFFDHNQVVMKERLPTSSFEDNIWTKRIGDINGVVVEEVSRT